MADQPVTYRPGVEHFQEYIDDQDLPYRIEEELPNQLVQEGDLYIGPEAVRGQDYLKAIEGFQNYWTLHHASPLPQVSSYSDHAYTGYLDFRTNKEDSSHYLVISAKGFGIRGHMVAALVQMKEDGSFNSQASLGMTTQNKDGSYEESFHAVDTTHLAPEVQGLTSRFGEVPQEVLNDVINRNDSFKIVVHLDKEAYNNFAQTLAELSQSLGSAEIQGDQCVMNSSVNQSDLSLAGQHYYQHVRRFLDLLDLRIEQELWPRERHPNNTAPLLFSERYLEDYDELNEAHIPQLFFDYMIANNTYWSSPYTESLHIKDMNFHKALITGQTKAPKIVIPPNPSSLKEVNLNGHSYDVIDYKGAEDQNKLPHGWARQVILQSKSNPNKIVKIMALKPKNTSLTFSHGQIVGPVKIFINTEGQKTPGFADQLKIFEGTLTGSDQAWKYKAGKESFITQGRDARTIWEKFYQDGKYIDASARYYEKLRTPERSYDRYFAGNLNKNNKPSNDGIYVYPELIYDYSHLFKGDKKIILSVVGENAILMNGNDVLIGPYNAYYSDPYKKGMYSGFIGKCTFHYADGARFIANMDGTYFTPGRIQYWLANGQKTERATIKVEIKDKEQSFKINGYTRKKSKKSFDEMFFDEMVATMKNPLRPIKKLDDLIWKGVKDSSDEMDKVFKENPEVMIMAAIAIAAATGGPPPLILVDDPSDPSKPKSKKTQRTPAGHYTQLVDSKEPWVIPNNPGGFSQKPLRTGTMGDLLGQLNFAVSLHQEVSLNVENQRRFEIARAQIASQMISGQMAEYEIYYKGGRFTHLAAKGQNPEGYLGSTKVGDITIGNFYPVYDSVSPEMQETMLQNAEAFTGLNRKQILEKLKKAKSKQ